MAGDASAVRGNVLSKKLYLTAEHEWRYPDRPTVQLSLPTRLSPMNPST